VTPARAASCQGFGLGEGGGRRLFQQDIQPGGDGLPGKGTRTEAACSAGIEPARFAGQHFVRPA
jgi:hypothetical protein